MGWDQVLIKALPCKKAEESKQIDASSSCNVVLRALQTLLSSPPTPPMSVSSTLQTNSSSAPLGNKGIKLYVRCLCIADVWLKVAPMKRIQHVPLTFENKRKYRSQFLWFGHNPIYFYIKVFFNKKKVEDVLRRLQVLHHCSFSNVSYVQASSPF